MSAPADIEKRGESIFEAAERELREETGALDFRLVPVCVYSVKGKNTVNRSDEDETFGMLFYADIHAFENELHSEIEKIIITEELINNWTYPLIQPKLIEEVERRLAF